MQLPRWSRLPALSRGGTGMRAWASGGAGVRPVPTAADILEQLETAVVVTDEGGNLQYANAHAVKLFGLPDHAVHLVGRSLVSVGFDEGDARRVNDLAIQ